MPALTLSKLTIDGVGPFDDATIDLEKATGRVVLFEGPNGSGKSTIVQLIAAACGNVNLERLVPGMSEQRATFSTSARRGQLETEYPLLWDPAGAVVAFDGLEPRVRPPSASARMVLSAPGAYLDRGYDGHLFQPLPKGSATPSQLSQFVTACEFPMSKTTWAAFAYRAHQPTPVIATAGPKDIASPPLRGALGFGSAYPVAADFGQFLTNLDNERTKAFTYARVPGAEALQSERYERIEEERQRSLRRFEEALSTFLERHVTISFSIDQQSPHVLFGSEEIPLDALGEGMRSSLSWLGDLLVRLERTQWTDKTKSPLDQDFWLILDEIDESLHPTLQTRIYPALLKLFPNARIYATTHSPFVVASLDEGTVVKLQPDAKTRRVHGSVETQALKPGQSLDRVVREVFQTATEVLDAKTREAVDAHEHAVSALRRGEDIEWLPFLETRKRLLALNDEVRTIVLMREARVRQAIDARLPPASAA